MSAVLSIDMLGSAAATEESRAAKRSRVFMRANARVRGSTLELALAIKDISSTGLRAIPEMSLSQGTHIEIDLKNIGWVAGQIVWVDANGVVGVRFLNIIDPERTRSQVSGSYGAGSSSAAPALRRL